jgi:large subunit ribosomal protein L6
MSRIGNLPVPLADGVAANLAGDALTIKGALGERVHTIPASLRVTVDADARQIRVERRNEERHTKALHGLTRNLIANMVRGVTEGYSRTLQIVGVGYSAKAKGEGQLEIAAGYSHPVAVDIPADLTVDPPETGSMLITGVGSVPCTTLRIRGIDKQRVGQFAARIRRIRPPEPYKAKGIRYEGEEIHRKAGKAFAAQE